MKMVIVMPIEEQTMETIVLDIEDLRKLVRGSFVSYSIMDNELIQKNGSYIGGFVDEWSWDIRDETTEAELIEMYHLCKKHDT